jgi:hypothetical protein
MTIMIKRLFAVAAVAVLISGPALAGGCPMAVKAATDGLAQNTSLTAEQKTEVQSQIDQGAKQHADGDHSASMATLKIALHTLGLD